MRAIARIFGVSSLLLPLLGCAGAQKRDVVNIAQRDLGCDKVFISEIEDGRYGAYGCGKGAVYMQVCDETGAKCHWGRLRHGHENTMSALSEPAPPLPREVLPAPPPAGRDVVPAPAPAQREIIQAPPPGVTAPPPGAGGENAPDSSGAAPPADQKPVPLSEGQLSDPYQTQVPAQPTTQRSEYPPPEPLQEQQPPPPQPNYVWMPGYWWWSSASWLWLPGYWCPPQVGLTFYPGGWYWSAGWWWYGPGGWAYPGSSVIVYNVPPRPNTVATVRTFTPNRVVAGSAGAHPGPVAHVTPHAPPGSAFSPAGSPLYHYPTPSRAVAHAVPPMGANGSVGRVVRPNDPVHAPPSFSRVPGYQSPNAPYRFAPYRGPAPVMRPVPNRFATPPRSAPPPRFSPPPRMAPPPRFAPPPRMAPPMRFAPRR